MLAPRTSRAAPDGTLCSWTSNRPRRQPDLFKKLTYDPVADFEPVGSRTITLALAVHPSVPAGNVKELIAYGRPIPASFRRERIELVRIAGGMLRPWPASTC